MLKRPLREPPEHLYPTDEWRLVEAGEPTLAFSLRVRDRQLRIELGHAEERYALEDGEPLKLTIRGRLQRLVAGTRLIVRHG